MSKFLVTDLDVFVDHVVVEHGIDNYIEFFEGDDEIVRVTSVSDELDHHHYTFDDFWRIVNVEA